MNVVKHLESSNIIFPGGYGPGIPVYRDRGLEILENMVEIFKILLYDENFQYIQVKQPELSHKRTFDKIYSNINDYKNIVRYNSELYITPDTLPLNILFLKQQSIYKSVLTISSFFRLQKHTIIPLFKDKNIFPAIQFDTIVSEDSVISVLSRLEKVYVKFYKELWIDVIVAELQDASHYAKKEIYFLAKHRDTVTKLGMIYLLQDSFKEALDIEAAYEIIDSGFSEKTLFKCIELNNRIPFSILDRTVDILFKDNKNKNFVLKQLEANNIKYKVIDSERFSMKRWKKTDVIFLLIVEEKVAIYENGTEEALYQEEFCVKYLVDRINSLKNIYSEISKNNFESTIESLCMYICSDCSADFYGVVTNHVHDQCIKCRKKTSKKLFVPNKKRLY